MYVRSVYTLRHGHRCAFPSVQSPTRCPFMHTSATFCTLASSSFVCCFLIFPHLYKLSNVIPMWDCLLWRCYSPVFIIPVPYIYTCTLVSVCAYVHVYTYLHVHVPVHCTCTRTCTKPRSACNLNSVIIVVIPLHK